MGVFRMRMIILFLVLLFIIGCAQEEAVREEQINDDAKLITSEGTYQGKGYQKTDITYEKDEEEFQNYFDPQLKDALEWIKENTQGTFLSWWDYGHMIRGYAGNDVVIYSPSEDILWSLSSGKWDEDASGKFSSSEEIENVAAALTAVDVDDAVNVMDEYGADYIFVTKRDIDSSFVLFRIVGLDEYLDGDYNVNDKAKATILFRMVDKEDIEGFELVYDDELVRVYKKFGSTYEKDVEAEQGKVSFTHHLFDLEKTDRIIPLGELEGGWHEAEVNNMALVHIKQPGGHGTPSERMNIYAPIKMPLISYSYYSYGDHDPSWTLIFEINKDKTLKLSALTDVSDKIKNKVGTAYTKGEVNLKTPILFEPGDVIGYTGVSIHNWDILFYDKKHINKFVNQARYEKEYMGERYLTAVCPFNFYSDGMRKEYVKLMGFNSPGQTTDCGSASRDVAGTLSGIWWLSQEGTQREEKGMFTSPLFIYSNSAGGTSLGYVNKKRYKIQKDNPTNKDPAKVRGGHCYELLSAWDNSAEGYAYFKIVSDMEMQLAAGNTKCPNSFPSEFETYYR